MKCTVAISSDSEKALMEAAATRGGAPWPQGYVRIPRATEEGNKRTYAGRLKIFRGAVCNVVRCGNFFVRFLFANGVSDERGFVVSQGALCRVTAVQPLW